MVHLKYEQEKRVNFCVRYLLFEHFYVAAATNQTKQEAWQNKTILKEGSTKMPYDDAISNCFVITQSTVYIHVEVLISIYSSNKKCT